MHLAEHKENMDVVEYLSTLSLGRRDNRTDALPMMDSIAWPIGLNKYTNFSYIAINFKFILGFAFLDMLLCLSGYKSNDYFCLCCARWWVLSSFNQMFEQTVQWVTNIVIGSAVAR